MRASFWRPLSRRGFIGTGSYPRLRAPYRVALRLIPGGDDPYGLLPLRAGHPCGHPRRRDFRCARSAVTVVGLERRTTTDQCAFHRVDPNLAIQVGSAALVVHARSSAPHPVACRDPCLPRQGLEVRFRLSRCSRHCLAAAPFAARKMRLTDFCNRLHQTSTLRTARFPAASPPASGLRLMRARSPARPGPKASRLRGWEPDSAYRTSHRVELRLTANLQLQPPPQRRPSSVKPTLPGFWPREPLT